MNIEKKFSTKHQAIKFMLPIKFKTAWFMLAIFCFLPSTTYSMGTVSKVGYQFDYEVGEILKKNGMHFEQSLSNSGVYYRNDQPWLKPCEKNCLALYRADEIPQNARIEIIKLMMETYEKNHRNINLTIRMYHKGEPKSHSIFFGRIKPYFELTIGH